MHAEISMVSNGVVYTPWGASDSITALGDSGAISVSTSSHGRIWIPSRMYAALPPQVRETSYSQGGWYEEDCDVCIPSAFFGKELGILPEHIAYSRAYVAATYGITAP